uniref:Membrane palmitoylated protein 3 n=1 Tax=Ursus maritimus TaxID=29073 RepID=A0A452U9T2_URSMA
MPVLSEDSGLHETLALLTSQLRPDSNHKEEMGFLRDVFSEKSLSYLMKIHEKLRYYERQSPTPVLHSAVALAEDVMEELQAASVHSDERELLQLLSTPHLRAMLVVHDTVAQKNFDPVLPPLPDNIDEDFDEESVKIVRLVKNKEPLGATIRRDEHSGAVVVARIMRGGAADRSGLVHVGDELREVNGITVVHKRPDEISQILVCAACVLVGEGGRSDQSKALPGARDILFIRRWKEACPFFKKGDSQPLAPGPKCRKRSDTTALGTK